MKGKRGWIRILEATMAILVITSILVVVYTKQPEEKEDASEFIYLLQKEVLDGIALDDNLRNSILAIGTSTPLDDPSFVTLTDFIDSKVPSTIETRIRICELTNPPTPCKLDPSDVALTIDRDIFVEETVILANLTHYSPKKVKLFMWENR